MRLQKYMALCGIASRRRSEEIILEGRVMVNGEVIQKLGSKVDLKKDIVKVDGKVIKIEEKSVYIMLNKPTGYVTTVKDEFNRKKVIDLIQGIEERIYPVGRLDYDTSGLLLLTNDGEITYKLTHPSNEIKKRYIGRVRGIPTETELKKFRNGLKIDDYITTKASIKVLNKDKDSSLLEMEIHEGKNRQIRKMCDAINHPIISLKRIAIEDLELGSLKIGSWKYLTNEEIEYLKNL
ncbi:pseudouridine synthase [Anaerosalibacter massiliensis]|uniref:Pseudouridine synthase n=1 Tax=Anaerosalibacter massiliensis TaxID=1347392 RepID=A0A9X2MER6_9FIRM|nr:pseudouridine synthase [Anaerosalibacter massiliensis]MCR2042650.1 rRNA pseudouridine synthase [Anaerosalibacter massiliensis]